MDYKIEKYRYQEQQRDTTSDPIAIKKMIKVLIKHFSQ